MTGSEKSIILRPTVRIHFFVLLQLFHALQYLSFPFRVEANRHAARIDSRPGATWKRLLLLYLGLLAAGYLVFDLPPVLEMMEMIEASRAFETNVNMMRIQDESLGQLTQSVRRR